MTSNRVTKKSREALAAGLMPAMLRHLKVEPTSVRIHWIDQSESGVDPSLTFWGGVSYAGDANTTDYVMFLNKKLDLETLRWTLMHECIHIAQMMRGDLVSIKKRQYWKGR